MLFKLQNNETCETAMWRFLKDNENNDNEFDIYSIMKSKTMREYYRNNIKLSTEAMIDIIGNSCTDMCDKCKYINNLKDHCYKNKVDEDVKLLERIRNYYSFFITLFYGKKVWFNNDIIYVLNRSNFVCNRYINTEWKDIPDLMVEYYSTISPIVFVNDNNSINYIKDNGISYNIYYLDAYYVNKNNETELLCTYDIKVINKEKFYVDILDINWSSNILYDMYKSIYNDSLYDINLFVDGTTSFYLPFNNKDNITIKIPWITIDLNGQIFKELSDIWYYYLLPNGYDEDKWFIDSYIELTRLRINDCNNKFSIFDYIK